MNDLLSPSDLAPGRAGPPRILHVFPSFAVGGAQVRAAAIMNRLGPACRHLVVSLADDFGCAERLREAVPFEAIRFPTITGERLPARLRRIRRTLARLAPDALVTSNWGAIEWAMANLWPPRLRHLHMEDGFGPEEAAGQIARRVWTRRLVLRGAEVLLPSRVLEGHARDLWRLPEHRLHYVPNGIDLARFHPDGPLAVFPGGDAPVIGTVAALRAEKNLGRLLRAAALLARDGLDFRLVLVGEGAERAALEALAAAPGLAGRVFLPGHAPDPAAAYRAMDIFALSSDTEQMPFSVLEAMASGLVVAATDVGDVREMLAPENRDLVVPKTDDALALALANLLRMAPERRAALGRANRARAEAEFDQEVMFRRHAALWGVALDAVPPRA